MITQRIQVLGKQFFKFGLVGVSNTVIAIIIYNGLLLINVHFIIAYTIAFLISVVNAYFWNNKYVFKSSTKKKRKTFTKVFLSYGSTYLLGVAILFTMVEYGGISKQLAQVLLLLITIPINFLLNKLWAFNEKM